MDQYVNTLLQENRNKYSQRNHSSRLYGAQLTEQESLLEEENNIPYTPSKIKSFIKKHSFYFIIALLLLIAAIIGIAVYFAFFTDRKKESKSEGFKEKFKATNKLNDEYEYVNSYINSVLGNSDDMTSIDENATSV